jgi:hypothetical protein
MEICNIDYRKAHEGEAAYFAGIKHTFRQRRNLASIARNEIMIRRNIKSEKDLRTVQNPGEIDSTPMRGAVHELPAVTLQVASQSDLEIVWDQLVSQHHYLGYQRLLGHRLKYLAFVQERTVAALSFSAPALKLRVRILTSGKKSDAKRKLTASFTDLHQLYVKWRRCI